MQLLQEPGSHIGERHHCGLVLLSFMGRSVIDLPVHSVAAILENLENFHLWNKFMIVSHAVMHS